MVNRLRLRLTGMVLAVLHLCTACFTYVPARTAPAAGAHVYFELTDAGRAAHAARIGPGVLELTGTLTGMQDDRYVVDVATVRAMRGPELPVDGISVTLAPGDVANPRVRTLSRGRTIAVVGTALAAVVAFIASKGFKAGSTPPEGPPGGGPDQ